MERFTWFPFNAYDHVFTSGLVGLVSVLVAIFVARSIKYSANSEIPDSKFNLRNILELFSEMILFLSTDLMGEHNAKKFFPALVSVFLFIFLNNLIGLIPGFAPPTENINTTLAAGIFIFIYYNYVGFKERGISYIKNFAGPILWLAPLMFPIELVSNSFRPVSLGLRLFGNMTGDSLVINIFTELVPLGVPVIFMAFGIFVAFFQAIIFVILSTIYLTLALSHD
jgi:F-type H+-transporting ATPase subunit a